MKVLFSKQPASFILIILLFLSLLISCSGESQEDNHKLYFFVDSTLLATKYENSALKFAFHPPVGCQPLSEAVLREVIARLDSSMILSDSIIFQLVQMFIDTTNKLSCSVSKIICSDIDSNLIHLTAIYSRLLHQKFPGATIKTGNFNIDSIAIIQFLILTENKVIFKLIFNSPTKNTLQIDYAIARSKYPEFIRNIESSIGSISTLN
jgi:hypothetical protein